MPTFSKQPLSGGTSGRAVAIEATSSPGTILHTVQATATSAKESVHLFVANTQATDHLITIEVGATGAEDQVPVTISARDGPILVIPGIPLTGTDAIVRAFATATGVANALGFVNRIV